MARLPIRVRLTLWYVILLALVLAALGAYLVLRLRTDLTADIDRSLASRADRVAATYQPAGGVGEFAEITNTALTGLPGGDSGAQLLSSSGTVVDTSDDPMATRPMLNHAQLATAVTHGRLRATVHPPAGAPTFRVLAQPITVDGQPRILVLATSLAGIDTAVDQLLIILLTGGPLALILAAASGWWVTGAALRPVASMTARARRIGVDRLHERVPPSQANDEVGRLADTLNEMLDRLEAGVAAQRRLVADTSHDLRTPLAVMRTELDVALAGELPDEAVDVLVSTAEEADRMTRIVDNLLALARIDQGELELLTQPVDLLQEARLTVDRFATMAGSKGLSLAVSGAPAVVEADRDRLGQVLTNLVDNAVKYTVTGDVKITVWRDESEGRVTVSDTGPGIPADELTNIFSRFYRVDPARTRSSSGGSGLGLAIADEIVRAHHGRIWAEHNPHGGSAFHVALPG